MPALDSLPLLTPQQRPYRAVGLILLTKRSCNCCSVVSPAAHYWLIMRTLRLDLLQNRVLALLLHWPVLSVTFCLLDQQAVSKRFSFPSGYPTVSERVSLSAHYSGDGGWGNQPSIAPHRSGSDCSHGETWHWSVLVVWPFTLGRALFISFFSTCLKPVLSHP